MKYVLLFLISIISIFSYAIDEKEECKDPVLTSEIASLKMAINNGSLSLPDGLEQLKVLSEDQVKQMQIEHAKKAAMMLIKREQTIEQYADIIEADPAKQEAIDAFMAVDWGDKTINRDLLRAQEERLASDLDKAFGGVHFRLNAFYHLGDASLNIRPKKSALEGGNLTSALGCNCSYQSDCWYGLSCGYGMSCSPKYECGPNWDLLCLDRCM